MSKDEKLLNEVREYVRHLTATPDVLATLKEAGALYSMNYTIENLRLSLEGLLTLLGADPKSGYGSHSSETNKFLGEHIDDQEE
tara:strand:- start:55 stop:306 length:252 start_codon:yes stop_codon:yes gene_type:complete